MKYLKYYKLFESMRPIIKRKNEEEIHSICKKYRIGMYTGREGVRKYTINSDGSIDVDGDVDLCDKGLTKLPLKFNNVSGNFYCSNNQLMSLSGAPQTVAGGFYCYNNNLTSLEGAPQTVGGYFTCTNNKLTSLDGLEFKSFKFVNLENNPIDELVKYWINSENREELIEYFVDMNIIQDNKIIMMRLEAFYEDMGLEMNIDFDEVKKYYEIIN